MENMPNHLNNKPNQTDLTVLKNVGKASEPWSNDRTTSPLRWASSSWWMQQKHGRVWSITCCEQKCRGMIIVQYTIYSIIQKNNISDELAWIRYDWMSYNSMLKNDWFFSIGLFHMVSGTVCCIDNLVVNCIFSMVFKGSLALPNHWPISISSIPTTNLVEWNIYCNYQSINHSVR